MIEYFKGKAKGGVLGELKEFAGGGLVGESEPGAVSAFGVLQEEGGFCLLFIGLVGDGQVLGGHELVEPRSFAAVVVLLRISAHPPRLAHAELQVEGLALVLGQLQVEADLAGVLLRNSINSVRYLLCHLGNFECALVSDVDLLLFL